MAEISLSGVDKIYPNGTHAVHSVNLEVSDGEFLIMVGPSGCAKSTILRMIAGLETPTGGTVSIGGRVVNDVAPKDRDIAMVFQSYALYPHMTVRENMAFGLKLRKMPQNEIDARVDDAARTLGLEAMLDRLPKQMSGGQRQRVAMGRAIVREPQAFLMDEPLSNLDAKLRVQMRAEIAKLHQRLGTTTVYVTHDQTEAMTLGQRICILRLGHVQQVDTPYEVYANPANIFVGGFIGSPGMNFFEGALTGDHSSAHIVAGNVTLPLPASVAQRLKPEAFGSGTRVVFGLRPEHLRDVHDVEPGAPQIPVLVDLVEGMGSESYVHFTTDLPAPDLSSLSDTQAGGDTCVARVNPDTTAIRGERFAFAPDLANIHIFDPTSQLTLLEPLAESRPERELIVVREEPAEHVAPATDLEISAPARISLDHADVAAAVAETAPGAFPAPRGIAEAGPASDSLDHTFAAPTVGTLTDAAAPSIFDSSHASTPQTPPAPAPAPPTATPAGIEPAAQAPRTPTEPAPGSKPARPLAGSQSLAAAMARARAKAAGSAVIESNAPGGIRLPSLRIQTNPPS